jgi:hypothetical protein
MTRVDIADVMTQMIATALSAYHCARRTTGGSTPSARTLAERH